MKKIALAAVTAGLLAITATPALAAVPGSTYQHHSGQAERPHQCYSGRSGERHGECYDERQPQHDGGGSILF